MTFKQNIMSMCIGQCYLVHWQCYLVHWQLYLFHWQWYLVHGQWYLVHGQCYLVHWQWYVHGWSQGRVELMSSMLLQIPTFFFKVLWIIILEPVQRWVCSTSLTYGKDKVKEHHRGDMTKLSVFSLWTNDKDKVKEHHCRASANLGAFSHKARSTIVEQVQIWVR